MFDFPKRIISRRYRIYEESLYDKGKWIRTVYTIRKRVRVLGIPIWVNVWDDTAKKGWFTTRTEARHMIDKLEETQNKTGWTKVMIDQVRFDH
jgi:hypothetical protein